MKANVIGKMSLVANGLERVDATLQEAQQDSALCRRSADVLSKYMQNFLQPRLDELKAKPPRSPFRGTTLPTLSKSRNKKNKTYFSIPEGPFEY